MRHLLKSVSAMVMGSGAQLAANALAGFLATAWLPVAERGVMILILSAAAILALATSAGIGNTLRARLPRTVGDDASALRRTYTTAALLTIGAAAVIGGAASILLRGIDERMATPDVVAVVALATSTQVAVGLLTDARFAAGRYSTAARWAAVGAISGLAAMTLVAAAAALVGIDISAVALVAGQYGALGLVVLLSMRSAFRRGELERGRPDRGVLGRFFLAGASTMVLPIAIVVVARSDRLVLGAVTTASVVAVYGLAATYAEMVRIIPTSIAQMAPARVAHGGALRGVLNLGMLSLGATTLASAVVGLLAWWLTVPIFGTAYAEAAGLTLLLLPGEILYALVVLANLVLIGGEWNRVATVIGVVSAPLAIGAFWVGSALAGAEGLAIARVIVLLLMASGGIAAVVVCLRDRGASARGVSAPAQEPPML